MTSQNVRVPADLGAAGKPVYKQIVAEYQLKIDELVVLKAACKTLDDIERLEKALVGQPLVMPGVAGQDRVHPLLVEIRGMRSLAASLFKQLRLPEPGESSVSRSAQARTAAQARWAKPGSA